MAPAQPLPSHPRRPALARASAPLHPATRRRPPRPPEGTATRPGLGHRPEGCGPVSHLSRRPDCGLHQGPAPGDRRRSPTHSRHTPGHLRVAATATPQQSRQPAENLPPFTSLPAASTTGPQPRLTLTLSFPRLPVPGTQSSTPKPYLTPATASHTRTATAEVGTDCEVPPPAPGGSLSMRGGRGQPLWGWEQVGSGGLNKPQDLNELALAVVHADAFAWPPSSGSPTDGTLPLTPETRPGDRH